MNKWKSLSAMSLAVLLLAACGSSDMGGILGGGSTQANAYEIRGVVDHVDTASRSIYLTDVSGYSNMLSSGNRTVRVYYDDRTPVDYQGQAYRPENLERGDQVSMRVDESGSTLVAESVTVLRDVSNGTTGSQASTIRGTVRYIDTSRRTIEIDRGSGSITTIEYESSTPVYFGNQTYRVTDIERGDEVDVRLRDLGSGRWIAQDINVTRSVSGGTTGSTSSYATFQGTIRSIDTVNRTMQLEAVNWISRFSGTNGTTTTVRYGSGTRVEVGGALSPMANLERGDVVEIHTATTSGSVLNAERVILVRDVRR